MDGPRDLFQAAGVPLVKAGRPLLSLVERDALALRDAVRAKRPRQPMDRIPGTLHPVWCNVFPLAEPGERWLPAMSNAGGTMWASDAGRVAADPHRKVRPRLCAVGAGARDGYLCFRIGRALFQPHRLVLLAFEPDRPDGHECCHENGDRTDNRRANLRWGSRSENATDKHRHGTMRGKLSEADAASILLDGEPLQAVSARLGVHVETVRDVRRGRTFRHVLPHLPRRGTLGRLSWRREPRDRSRC